MPSQTRLKFLDRYLTLWIFLAMGLGLIFGAFLPESVLLKMAGKENQPNIFLALGLILMMYPPLAKVQYHEIFSIFQKPKLLSVSLVLNWIIGPLLMFTLGLLFLKNEPNYFHGLMLIGIARCIAMVLVWNDLGQGNREYAAALVAINSLFQVITYALMAWLFITILPPYFGIEGIAIELSIRQIAYHTLIYLGIPFFAGIVSQKLLIHAKGKEWFNRKYLPRIGPIGLYALLFTIVFMFSLRAKSVLELPLEVLKIALPLSSYFILMFLLSFFLSKRLGAKYDENAAVSFTATGNNFELAIAISIGLFGIHSDAAFAGIIGPLIEVPALILLVKLSLYLKRRYYAKLR